MEDWRFMDVRQQAMVFTQPLMEPTVQGPPVEHVVSRVFFPDIFGLLQEPIRKLDTTKVSLIHRPVDKQRVHAKTLLACPQLRERSGPRTNIVLQQDEAFAQ